MSATSTVHEAQPRAQAALTRSPIYELHRLVVEHDHERLVIVGVVSSFYHKQLAQELVRTVCQDVDVLNAIQVQ
jgi:hypothetical protein